jgi:S-adenosylmethionine:tRNA ribosyltransferase-isomerase
LDGEGSVEALLERAGAVPLPPYVHRARRSRGLPEEMPELDRERYQTVYAREPGAVAAPTAGLHFTEALLERVREAGVEVRALSLLVGPGTFQPVRAERVCDHRLEAEFFRLPAETACAVSDALQQGRRVVATGTTACRVLEHVARHGPWQESSGWTDLFIYPPFEFKAVGALITNFHLPRSTLLMLVAAFAGRDKVLDAYREAVREGYRFYSYGDAMFIA